MKNISYLFLFLSLTLARAQSGPLVILRDRAAHKIDNLDASRAQITSMDSAQPLFMCSAYDVKRDVDRFIADLQSAGLCPQDRASQKKRELVVNVIGDTVTIKPYIDPNTAITASDESTARILAESFVNKLPLNVLGYPLLHSISKHTVQIPGQDERVDGYLYHFARKINNKTAYGSGNRIVVYVDSTGSIRYAQVHWFPWRQSRLITTALTRPTVHDFLLKYIESKNLSRKSDDQCTRLYVDDFFQGFISGQKSGGNYILTPVYTLTATVEMGPNRSREDIILHVPAAGVLDIAPQ